LFILPYAHNNRNGGTENPQLSKTILNAKILFMKKKHLQLKQLKLTKETVLNMSAVKGGAPGTTPATADCAASMQAKCAETQQAGSMDTQGTVMPCCPACLSDTNNTLVKQYCGIIVQTVDAACTVNLG
jgi:hypothetical protein